jgi:hypothetical protein
MPVCNNEDGFSKGKDSVNEYCLVVNWSAAKYLFPTGISRPDLLNEYYRDKLLLFHVENMLMPSSG